MISNLAQISQAHKTFLAKHSLMVQRQSEEAGKFGVDYVNAHPTFKPRTGKLQKGTTYKVLRNANGRVIRLKSSESYAASIDSGAKPHVIRPRRANVLRFVGRDGHLVFTRRVNHPGNKPYKFLYRATTAAGRILEQSLRLGMDRLAREF